MGRRRQNSSNSSDKQPRGFHYGGGPTGTKGQDKQLKQLEAIDRGAPRKKSEDPYGGGKPPRTGR